MTSTLNLQLNTQADQHARLRQLQVEFAAACNAVAPVARDHRCWNRVTLHHLVYRDLREKFPQLGSQMACNVVYSVARTYRAILNHPLSPWNMERRRDLPLPSLNFLNDAPVYFDRHTLSIRGKTMSMFTLDGRLRFELNVAEEDVRRFSEERLREIVLREINGVFTLQFQFATADEAQKVAIDSDLPQYVVVTGAIADSTAPRLATAVLS